MGQQINPVLSIGVTLSSELDFTYGFDTAVPNNSSIILNVGEFANSSTSSFADSIFAALPFIAEVENVNLTLATGFQLQLILGISFFENVGFLAAGVLLDIHKVIATVSEVERANIDSTTSMTDSNSSLIDDILRTFTHVVPTIAFDFTFQIEEKPRAWRSRWMMK